MSGQWPCKKTVFSLERGTLIKIKMRDGRKHVRNVSCAVACPQDHPLHLGMKLSAWLCFNASKFIFRPHHSNDAKKPPPPPKKNESISNEGSPKGQKKKKRSRTHRWWVMAWQCSQGCSGAAKAVDSLPASLIRICQRQAAPGRYQHLISGLAQPLNHSRHRNPLVSVTSSPTQEARS